MSTEQTNVRLIGCAESELESAAVSQLKGTAGLPGVAQAVGLADLHPGRTGPVGMAIASEVIYPHLVGNDVGCGMQFWQLDLPARKLKLDRWEKRLTGLDEPWEQDTAAWLEAFGVPAGIRSSALGTIGGGNHFAELQMVEEVADARLSEELKLDARQLCVLIHSGSRSVGQALLEQQMSARGHAPLLVGSEDERAYVADHDLAVRWACANRSLIGARFAKALGAEGHSVLDTPHNFVARSIVDGRACWIHRKGANPADRGAVVIPGSRGSRSYLVQPAGSDAHHLFSLPHGAGRKWARSDCKARLSGRYSPDDLSRTELGSRVICGDRALLYEEAPQAYKDVTRIVSRLVETGLVRIIATLRPVLTYKCRRAEA